MAGYCDLATSERLPVRLLQLVWVACRLSSCAGGSCSGGPARPYRPCQRRTRRTPSPPRRGQAPETAAPAEETDVKRAAWFEYQWVKIIVALKARAEAVRADRDPNTNVVSLASSVHARRRVFAFLLGSAIHKGRVCPPAGRLTERLAGRPGSGRWTRSAGIQAGDCCTSGPEKRSKIEQTPFQVPQRSSP